MMMGLVAVLTAGSVTKVEQAIREQRSVYNAAIAARDVAGIERQLAPTYVVLPGLTGTPLSREGLLSLFVQSFRDPTFVTYVRSPVSIKLSSSAKRVAETGDWTGTWNKPDGRMTVSGVYQAFWILSGGRWELVNESFVTLDCKGSAACSSVD